MTQPLTDQQLDAYETAARNAARIGSGIDPAAVLELAAEIRRQRDELAAARERHLASLRRADRINNELMEEVQRYADGAERPVLWSVYNAMHLRAANAEGLIETVRATHKPRTERHGSGCVQCGIVWPCPTYTALTPPEPASASVRPVPAPEAPAPQTAAVAAADGRTEAATGGDPYANGVCTYGEDQAPGSGCIKPAGHNGAHYVTPGDVDLDD